MSADDIVKTLATSPVLIAAIPAAIALVGGRYLLQAKDERLAALKEAHAAELKARDERIAVLAPAGLREELDAIKAFYQERAEQLSNDRDTARKALEDSQDLNAKERERLEAELRDREQRLSETLVSWKQAQELADACDNAEEAEFRIILRHANHALPPGATREDAVHWRELLNELDHAWAEAQSHRREMIEQHMARYLVKAELPKEPAPPT